MRIGRERLPAVTLISVSLLAILLGGVWLLGSQNATEPPVSASATSDSELNALWPDDLDMATEAAIADAIVIGRVQGAQTAAKGVKLSKERRTELKSQGYTDAEIDAWLGFEDYVVHTRSVFAIGEVLKGDYAPGDTVKVRHRGGVYEGHKTSAEGFPQLHPGREYVLLIGMAFNGEYEVVDAWEIHQGMATSSLGGRTRSMSLEELVALIKQHANYPNPFAVSETAESTTAPEPAAAATPADEASQTTAP